MQNQAAAKEYLTTGDVMQRLHISKPTLNKYVNDGILKAYKIGGRVLFISDEIDSAVRANQKSAQAAA